MPEFTSSTPPKNPPSSFKETIDSLIIAFILAFVFRAFGVEAFVIPTGSMADTLRGAHFRLTCPTCSYQFNYGFLSKQYGYPEGVIPRQAVNITSGKFDPGGIPLCPICGTKIDTNRPYRVSNGDRILVLKYIYHFIEPQIWDVVVFKNPEKPSQNFIKRLIGRPGETIEIIDGDVYLKTDEDGPAQIQRKPDHIQQTLWIPAYVSDYQPAPETPGARNHLVWDEPFKPENGSAWEVDCRRHKLEFHEAEQLDRLEFNPRRIRKLTQCFAAYNGDRTEDSAIVSDLKLEFVLIPHRETGAVAVMLGKYGRIYRADINFDGACSITSEYNSEVLKSQQFEPLSPQRPVKVSFALVDHTLKLRLGNNRLDYTGPDDPAAWGYHHDPKARFPSVTLAGKTGSFTLKQVALYRDVHYTNSSGSSLPGRGTEGDPFKLEQNEFFVLGDNSPQSHDSRFWDEPGLGNGRDSYTPGVVPRDYLLGRALFVYWPGGFYPHSRIPFAVIPNVGDMRFIH